MLFIKVSGREGGASCVSGSSVLKADVTAILLLVLLKEKLTLVFPTSMSLFSLPLIGKSQIVLFKYMLVLKTIVVEEIYLNYEKKLMKLH